jgi:hypothetical protein
MLKQLTVGFTPPFTGEAVGKQMITDLDYN